MPQGAVTSSPIDDKLVVYFSPEALRQAYPNYRERKTDRVRREDDIRIPMGADGVTYGAFEKELDRNARNISRKVLAGAYLFYPFREVEMEKEGTTDTRTLSIASIRDVLVQQQLYETVYPSIEKLFQRPSVNHVSFAYRKRRSSPQAALYIYKYLRDGYVYALDADIVKYFDRIPHDRLLDTLGRYIDQDSLTFELLERFVKTDRVLHSTYRGVRRKGLLGKRIFHKLKPRRMRRDKGVPQGGILSGMLANLYLHAFDRWVMEEVKRDVDLRYVRYADDFVILVKDYTLLASLRDQVQQTLKDMGLELHQEPKTKLLDVARDSLDFVGFHFTPDNIAVRSKNITKFKDRFVGVLTSEREWHGDRKFKTVFRRMRHFITWRLNFKIHGIRDESCPKCGKSKGDRPRSWIGYFSVVTDVQQLRELDHWIRAQIAEYFHAEYGYRISRKDLRRAGLESIEQEYYRLRKRKLCTCEEPDTSVSSESLGTNMDENLSAS